VATLGDHFRTRLTHTLEVSQIARTLARCFRLNEDLAEAIALAHDLGHTPFGHVGERALASLCPGGFEHQKHSLRIIETLANGRGLNLTALVRDGVGKHSKGGGPIFVTGPEAPLSLEGQLTRAADIIAYLAHDLDDAYQSGLLEPQNTPPEINQVFGPRASTRIKAMVTDLFAHSQEDETGLYLSFSPEMRSAMSHLRLFLQKNVYEHPKLAEELKKGDEIIRLIYGRLMADESLTGRLGLEPVEAGERDRSQAVVDFVAGMTDRYALGFGAYLKTGSWPEASRFSA
jgi:dGTPase